MSTKLSVDSSKTKIMFVKSQKKDKPCIIYNDNLLECVESFKYLGLEVLSNHVERMCYPLLGIGKRAYYTFENTCNHVGSSRNTLSQFGETSFSMGWKDGVVTSLNILGKSLKNIFLQSFYNLKKQTLYTLLFLEVGSLPIDIMAMEKVVEYKLKVQSVPHIDFLERMGSNQKDPNAA